MKAYKTTQTTGQSIWLPNRLLSYLCDMKAKIKDTHEEFEFETAEEFVTQLRESSRTNSKDNHNYMLDYAHRAVMVSDEDIRATSEKEFLEDLIKLNHVVIIG